jgi:hypothetical protein
MSTVRVLHQQQQQQHQQQQTHGSTALLAFDTALSRWTYYLLIGNAVLFIVLFACYAARQQYVLKHFPGRTRRTPEETRRVKSAVLRARRGGGGST